MLKASSTYGLQIQLECASGMCNRPLQAGSLNTEIGNTLEDRTCETEGEELSVAKQGSAKAIFFAG